jgi:hypothetical protein
MKPETLKPERLSSGSTFIPRRHPFRGLLGVLGVLVVQCRSQGESLVSRLTRGQGGVEYADFGWKSCKDEVSVGGVMPDSDSLKPNESGGTKYVPPAAVRLGETQLGRRNSGYNLERCDPQAPLVGISTGCSPDHD